MSQLLDPALVERESTTAKWIEGGAEPKGQITRLRLRDAYRATRLIVAAYDNATAEAWFFGSNSRLDDEAPAWVLRHARSLDDLRMVVPAAKAFARAHE